MSEPVHRALGMTDEEFSDVRQILGRDPSDAELAMYSVMWSEHCSYKSSRAHLGRFPTEAPWVVVGPGENAGVVDIGDGWLAAIRIESHNHPSFVEPYEGAATGVGGILRDVLTMGARPIGLWDAIRFGSLADARQRYLFGGVVAGIAGYGNAVGVPTLGGEIEFDPTYTGNPLVNVLCLGLMRKESLVLRAASGEGNLAVLIGNATGRDGIGGASVLASASFDPSSDAKRPSVQVGDPFEEKKLIEACLELFDRDLVVAIQDLGAAGIACATSESAAGGGMAMAVDLDAVHVREGGMSAAELLVSESQERMLAIVERRDLEEVERVTGKWDVQASVIGTVKTGTDLTVSHEGSVVADIPAASLSDDAPLLHREVRRPDTIEMRWNTEPTVGLSDPSTTLLRLLGSPNVADPSWVYEQYDHMLFLSTVGGPGSDGSLLRVHNTNKGLGVSVDGHGRRCELDPRRGAARLVWESALNVAVTGARPLAVVDNLNFGNPEKPEVMWQFTEVVEGISQACRDLGVPVVGGNVSFYNETDGTDIHPTPVIGMLGLADPIPIIAPSTRRAEPGMDLWLIGPSSGPDYAGSEVQALDDRLTGRPLAPDPMLATAVVEAAIELAHIAPVAHDVSRGGIAVAVAEIAIRSQVGVELEPGLDWFGEGPHRLLVAAPAGPGPESVARAAGTEARVVGKFGGSSIHLGDDEIALSDATSAWRHAIPTLMASK